MNNVINYSIIIILSLVSFIGIINTNSIEEQLKVKGSRIVLFFIILMTYMTLVSYPVKNILNKNIKSIKLPKGKKGPRGYRGKGGSNAICDTCGDDLCLKKILFNITNTYNYWRSLNGLNVYSDSFVIKNEYLKDKIMKHCKSKEFQKIIRKFGSNKKTGCPDNLEKYGCGAYDYMFKMWSIWTLIILKYKNGAYFLESDSLTDVDFDGLIEADDCFLDSDIVIYNGEKYKIDKSQESKRIHPMYHIKRITQPPLRNIVHFKSLTLCTENTVPKLIGTEISDSNINRSWNLMFDDANAYLNTQYSGDNVPGLKIKRIKRNIDFGRTNPTSKVNEYNSTIEFKAQGVNEDFFKNDGIPDRGRLNPFEEIKRYDAWYWGRDEKLKPEIIVSKPKIDDFKKTCPSGRIKIKKTNDYNLIFSSKNKKFTKNGNNIITISDILGDYANDENSDIFFLRPSKFIDKNEHGYFKEYRPIGDVLITETDLSNVVDCEPTFPSTTNEDDGYNGIIKKIKKLQKTTYLVSGDIKSPIDYELQRIYKKQHGINRGSIGLSIWKPIAPDGYTALGFVADQRYFNFPKLQQNSTEVTFNTIKSLRGLPKPSLDIIACVPNDLLIDNDNGNGNGNIFTPIKSSFFDQTNVDYVDQTKVDYVTLVNKISNLEKEIEELNQQKTKKEIIKTKIKTKIYTNNHFKTNLSYEDISNSDHKDNLINTNNHFKDILLNENKSNSIYINYLINENKVYENSINYLTSIYTQIPKKIKKKIIEAKIIEAKTNIEYNVKKIIEKKKNIDYNENKINGIESGLYSLSKLYDIIGNLDTIINEIEEKEVLSTKQVEKKKSIENDLFRHDKLNTFTDAPFNKIINMSSNIICRGPAKACKYSNQNDCNDDDECVWDNNCILRPNVLPHNPRTSIKDKKYSILRLYD